MYAKATWIAGHLVGGQSRVSILGQHRDDGGLYNGDAVLTAHAATCDDLEWSVQRWTPSPTPELLEHIRDRKFGNRQRQLMQINSV
jgi:hypothetical protein